MAISTTQISGLTRKRFPGLNYENLVQVQARNLPALYSAAQVAKDAEYAKTATEIDQANAAKELKLAQDRIDLERQNLTDQRAFAEKTADELKKQAEVAKYTGALGTGLNAYTAYKTGQLVNKLSNTPGAPATPETPAEPGMVSKAMDYVKENVYEPVKEAAQEYIVEPAKELGGKILDTGKAATDALGLTKPTAPGAPTAPEVPGALTPEATPSLDVLPQADTGLVTQTSGPGLNYTPGVESNTTQMPTALDAVLNAEGSGAAGAATNTTTTAAADLSADLSTGFAPNATAELGAGGTTEAAAAAGEGASSGVLGAGGIAALAAVAVKMSYDYGKTLADENKPGTWEHSMGEQMKAPFSLALDPGTLPMNILENAGVGNNTLVGQTLGATQFMEQNAYEGMNQLLAGNWDEAGALIRKSLTPAPLATLTGKAWLCVAVAMYVGMNANELQYTRQISDYATAKYNKTFWFYIHNGYKLIRRIKDSGLNLREFFSEVKKTLVDDSIEFVKKGNMEHAARNYWLVSRSLFARFMPELDLPHPNFQITENFSHTE